MKKREQVSVSWMLLLLLICLVFGVLVGQSSSQFIPFGICYTSCFAACTLGSRGGPGPCSLQCLKNCIVSKSTVGGSAIKDTHSFCKLGCATAFCSNFSSNQNYASEKVGDCVDGCSRICAKKNP